MPNNRHSIRLLDFDYSVAGAYFFTFCTFHREMILGKITNGNMTRSHEGDLVISAWHELPRHYPGLVVDEFIVMPDHVHGIVFIEETDGVFQRNSIVTGSEKRSTHGLPEFIRALKSFSARWINIYRETTGAVWQRGYYERVIRNERDLDHIREYIQGNPVLWEQKRDYFI